MTERTGFRRFEHHAVAGKQSGHDLGEGKNDGGVPGYDRYHHAIGTVEDECPSVRRRESAAGVELGRVGERHALTLRHAHELPSRFGQRLAVLADEHRGTPIDIVLQSRECVRKNFGPCREGPSRPSRLGSLGSRDGQVHVLGRAAHDCADQVFRPRRVANLEAERAIDPLSPYQHVFGDGGFDVLLARHGHPPGLLFIAVFLYI
jgi:hypothetical protein